MYANVQLVKDEISKQNKEQEKKCLGGMYQIKSL